MARLVIKVIFRLSPSVTEPCCAMLQTRMTFLMTWL